MVTFYNDHLPCLAHSKNNLIMFHASQQQLSSELDTVCMTETTFRRNVADSQNRFEGGLVKEKKTITNLQKSRASIKQICLHITSFIQKIPTCPSLFAADLRHGFASFWALFMKLAMPWLSSAILVFTRASRLVLVS